MVTIKSTGIGVLFLAATMLVWGCSHTQSPEVSMLQEEIEQKDQEIASLKETNEEKDKIIEQYRSELDQQAASGEMAMKSGEEMLPAEASPGECFARVFVPPTYVMQSEQVLKHEASERIEVIPAQYEWVEEQVLVSEASEEIEVIPARYEWVEEKVLVKEESSQMVEVPAQYEWVEEQVEVKPAHSVWKKGRGPIEKIDHATGEIMCLVEVPASYETVKKRVLKSPATTRLMTIPAEYATVKKQVLVQPAEERRVAIPARYETVRVQKMVSPPEEQRIEIPAEYETVTKQVLAEEGHMEWRPVFCETNVTPDFVRQLQAALLEAGHDPGPVDGNFGPQTANALRNYQREQGLATGGLTYESVESLGIRTEI